jgi:hypothetical protein
VNIKRTTPVVAPPKPRHSRRVLLAVPLGGFGAQLGAIRAWLDVNCGPSGWTWSPAGTGGVVNDALAFYFTEPAQAEAFIRRFCCAYRPLRLSGLS